MHIGVLALQGDFSKHAEILHSLSIKIKQVRKSEDLEQCQGLIIPGGESTAILKQLEFIQMRKSLFAFAQQKPVFGTCAGLILMSSYVHAFPFQPLQILDVEVERNAFGRQTQSFQTSISLELSPGELQPFPAFFIRAPRIRKWGKKVEVLAKLGEEPILVRQGCHLGASFHQKLRLIHKFINILLKLFRKIQTENV